LSRDFYERDTDVVARALLGKRLVRKLCGQALTGIIVETEAYFGADDPASRAYRGVKKHNELMWDTSGKAFIYNVHRYWMFNVVAHKPKKVGAVLIRALEPTKGIEIMKKHRPVEKASELTNGPGKLTIALMIDKRLNGLSVTSYKSEVVILENVSTFEIGRSHRVGVRADLERKLRFYIKTNKFVSNQ
jgi:DNA-3-methyladenine glycosylase